MSLRFRFLDLSPETSVLRRGQPDLGPKLEATSLSLLQGTGPSRGGTALGWFLSSISRGLRFAGSLLHQWALLFSKLQWGLGLLLLVIISLKHEVIIPVEALARREK